MKLISGLFYFYKFTLSFALRVLIGPGCRFQPTCSEYAKEAVERFGVLKGSKLAVVRLLRCHPFSKESLFDPPPIK